MPDKVLRPCCGSEMKLRRTGTELIWCECKCGSQSPHILADWQNDAVEKMTEEAKRIIEILRYCPSGDCERCYKNNGCIDEMDDAAGLIEQLIAELKELRDAQGDKPKAEIEAAKSGRWIRVSDEPPEEDDLVLVYEQGNIDRFHRYSNIGACVYYRGGWSEKRRLGVMEANNITHWMQFPSLPKEG